MQTTQFKINPVHLTLEIVGSIIAGIGLAEVLANTNIVPEHLRFENYGWYMVGIGMLMGIPHLNGILKHAKSVKEKETNVKP